MIAQRFLINTAGSGQAVSMIARLYSTIKQLLKTTPIVCGVFHSRFHEKKTGGSENKG